MKESGEYSVDIKGEERERHVGNLQIVFEMV